MKYIAKFLFPGILLFSEKKWWGVIIFLINVVSLLVVSDTVTSSIFFRNAEYYYTTGFYIESLIENMLFGGEGVTLLFIIRTITIRLLCLGYIQLKNTDRLQKVGAIVVGIVLIVILFLNAFGHHLSSKIEEFKTYSYSSALAYKYLPVGYTTDRPKLVATKTLYNWKNEGTHLISGEMSVSRGGEYDSLFVTLLVQRSIFGYSPVRIEYYPFYKPVTIVSFDEDSYTHDEESLLGNTGSYGYNNTIFQERALQVLYTKHENEINLNFTELFGMPYANDKGIANYRVYLDMETVIGSLLDGEQETNQWNIIEVSTDKKFTDIQYTKKVGIITITQQYSNGEILLHDFSITKVEDEN